MPGGQGAACSRRSSGTSPRSAPHSTARSSTSWSSRSAAPSRSGATTSCRPSCSIPTRPPRSPWRRSGRCVDELLAGARRAAARGARGDAERGSAAAAFDLLVVGDINPDVVVGARRTSSRSGRPSSSQTAATLGLGGSAAITACGAARLGLRTAIVGAVGDDAAGRLALDELARRGVDTSAVRVVSEQETGLTVHVLSDGDRAMITSRGALDELEASAVPAGLVRRLAPRARGLLLPPAAPHAGPARPVRGSARPPARRPPSTSTGTRPSAGRAGWPRCCRRSTSSSSTPPRPPASLGRLTPRWRPRYSPRAAPFRWSSSARPARLAHDGCRLVRVNAPVASVVDSVGAGDSFDAGFLCGRLSGWTAGRSLALGVICGSLSVRATGGVAAQPDRRGGRGRHGRPPPRRRGDRGVRPVTPQGSGLPALARILAANRRGERRGVTSVCSASPFVLDAAAARAARRGSLLCIESTANQVNQDGGYTGMTPAGFRAGVRAAAAAAGCPTTGWSWAATTWDPTRGGPARRDGHGARPRAGTGLRARPGTRRSTSTPACAAPTIRRVGGALDETRSRRRGPPILPRRPSGRGGAHAGRARRPST